MNTYPIRNAILVALMSFCVCAQSQTKLPNPLDDQVLVINAETVTEQASNFSLQDYLYVLPDSQGDLSLEQVLSPELQSHFSDSLRERLSAFDSKVKNYWLRFTISHEAALSKDWLVNFSSPNVQLYTKADSSSPWTMVESGIFTNYADRPFQDQYLDIPFIPLHLPAHSQNTYLVRLEIDPLMTRNSPLFKPFDQVLIEPQTAMDKLFRYHLVLMLVLGITLTVAIYHFILYAYNRDHRFLYLALYNMSLFLLTFSYGGYMAEWFYADNLELFHRFNGMLMLLISAVTTVWLLRSFAETKARFPRIDKSLRLIMIIHLVLLIPAVFISAIANQGLALSATLSVVVMIWLLFNTLIDGYNIFVFSYAWRKGVRNAGIYLIAFVVLVVNVYSSILDYTGFFEQSFGFRLADFLHPDIGIAIHGLILAFGLAASFKALQQEKLASETLRRLEQEKVVLELEKVNQLKDQFLANTSHELRTPLNGIIGLSESIMERVDDADVKDNIQMIVASGKRLGTLVNDLLDFSKLRNFDIELRTKPLDLRSMVAVVLRLSQPLLGWKEISLHNEVPEELAPIKADENRLQQILHNLIGNAIKFTEEGKIVVRAKQEGEMIKIEVVDSGIGIPLEKQALIFEEFQQADGSIAREFGGTGLGLTITQQLVRLHGGKIGVESEAEQKGATFWFTLPLSTNTEQKVFQTTEIDQELLPLRPMLPVVVDTVSEKPRVLTKAFSEGGNMKILVVDDDPINQQVLKNHLADSNFELAFAANGEDALEVLETAGPFDLVLLDVMMPKMSGFEVCERIRENYLPSELPVIMVTAKNQVNDLVQGLELGANDYLAKPFSKQEFLARVHTQLDLHRIFDITGRFIPNQFIRSLGYGRITEVKLGDQVEKDVSVLFSDIRSYTSLSEQMSPEDTFRFVNAFHGRMGPIIQEHGGFVNQYLGDAIMAIFPETAQGALDAAIAMQKSLNEYNQDRIAKERQPIDIGIGFHSGPLIMGIIGDEKRMDAATISDTVNTASRVESLTKHFGANILLTEVNLSEVSNPQDYHLRFLGSVQVKGRQKAVRLYECYDGDTDERILLKERTIDFFEMAMERYYLRDFEGAVAAFGQLLMVHPEDQVAQHFRALAEQYRIEGVAEDWTGIQRMQLK